jgi:hypothetical protein
MDNSIKLKNIVLGVVLFLFTPTFIVAEYPNTLKSISKHKVSVSTMPSKTPFLTLTKNELLDRIKGGWAGQTIGVTYGGPTEFKYMGKIIPDSVDIPWYKGYLKKTMIEMPWLYDDIYMDLTFVEIIEKLGVDAPIDSFANAFAYAPYALWHANQAARRNILDGIKPPMSGHWKHNVHADDIDYQIEADFSGLMSPGMPNTASKVNDEIGHMVSYGDGWYGGVYVGAMYALAFVHDDVNLVVQEALKTIPKKRKYYKCISSVIKWHGQYPTDWKKTWQLIEDNFSDDWYCPEGHESVFNINARINSAYVVLGLLYGQGDFMKTIDIATRAGQDSDCNPATALGILGTMYGYDNFPSSWKEDLKEIENMDFVHTTTSLNRAYAMSFNHALQMITKNGGKVYDDSVDSVEIKVQTPKAVRYEKSFANLKPIHKIDVNKSLTDQFEIEFVGRGIVISGEAFKESDQSQDKEILIEVEINGLKRKVLMPTSFATRRLEIFADYELSDRKHKITIHAPKQLGYGVKLTNYITYK